MSETARKIVEDCRFCPMCRDVCTAGVVTGLESHTSRGFALLADRWYRRGSLPAGGAEALYACTQCGLCKATCASERDLPEAILAMRQEFVERQIQPRAVLEARANAVIDGPVLDDTSKIQHYHPDLGEVVFDAGGLLKSGATASIVEALQSLAEQHGVSFSVMESAPMCEHVLADLGYVDDAVASARQYVECLQASGAKQVVTACSQCYDMFLRHYPRWGITWPEDVRVTHVAAWLKGLPVGPLPDSAVEGRIWLYHDDASLARLSVMHDTPRAVLDQLLPKRWLEFPLCREQAYACGATGALPLLRSDIAMGAAKRLFDAALEMAAGHEATPCIVTACARCASHLLAAQKALASPVHVWHLAELAAGKITRDVEGVAS